MLLQEFPPLSKRRGGIATKLDAGIVYAEGCMAKRKPWPAFPPDCSHFNGRAHILAEYALRSVVSEGRKRRRK
jgi:hypothetical protein